MQSQNGDLEVWQDMEGDIQMKINITFSGLLNVIDGVTPTTSQRLIFMTTNHLEKLDRALIPPGQIDLSLQIGNATLHQTLELFQKFYEDPKLIIEMEFTGVDMVQGYLIDLQAGSFSGISGFK
ncbi:hypothetical protein MJO28_008087 [Puccinia striiformis f. sp. tritici]|uniref:Uncharacterized protein n=1 Tax=Puccinia striiformis f. sp. tritici TaxID=168172 RepID=A0ACC0EBP3_9BASI|nr:hypothetical protein MJO28_008087 [Puccinia striiformis f. sp. tritici]